jgi:fluoride ion exporter CrcB/FEX
LLLLWWVQGFLGGVSTIDTFQQHICLELKQEQADSIAAAFPLNVVNRIC